MSSLVAKRLSQNRKFLPGTIKSKVVDFFPPISIIAIHLYTVGFSSPDCGAIRKVLVPSSKLMNEGNGKPPTNSAE